MKFFLVLSFLFGAPRVPDFRLLLEPPIVRFSARKPALPLHRRPRKIVDPTLMIRVSALRHKVRPALVKSIVAVESAFDANAVSRRGAVGLMQLSPAMAHRYGANPLVPEENIDAGTQYLGTLIQRYARYRDGLKRAIAAYNAGPGVVDRYRGVPPFRETRGYVLRVLSNMKRFEREQTL